MLRSLSGLWKAYRGRRAAVATILPLVQESRTRCQGIADPTWLDPYMIGFMTMLITLSARHRVRGIDSLALGLVQQDAWSDITGLQPELLGERALNLSVSDNRTFALGCQNAIAFDVALNRNEQLALFDDRHLTMQPCDAFRADALQDPDLCALWNDCFESHVVRELPQ